MLEMSVITSLNLLLSKLQYYAQIHHILVRQCVIEAA